MFMVCCLFAGHTSLVNLVVSLTRSFSFVPLGFSVAYFVRGKNRVMYYLFSSSFASIEQVLLYVRVYLNLKNRHQAV